jgi:hypothetical protein
VAVLPIASDFDDRRVGEAREVAWTKAGPQHLRSGWLRARTLTPFYTIRARRSEARLEIDPPQNGRLKVANQLGTPVEHLLLCDAEGKLYYGEHLAREATAELAAVENAVEATRPILEAFDRSRLQPADSMGAWLATPPAAARKAAPAFTPAGSRMEAGLAEALQQVTDGTLEPRTYVAIVARSPEVELGVATAKEEAGFHVVSGEW